MARLLQFTTGCSQLPPGGFQQLSPRFQITAAPTFENLPTAHTWYFTLFAYAYTIDINFGKIHVKYKKIYLISSFNQLCLPDYECYDHFEKALLLAISEGTEGFGMI